MNKKEKIKELKLEISVLNDDIEFHKDELESLTDRRLFLEKELEELESEWLDNE